jgi:5-keto 4-deoxyuronate isomerase
MFPADEKRFNTGTRSVLDKSTHSRKVFEFRQQGYREEMLNRLIPDTHKVVIARNVCDRFIIPGVMTHLLF